MDRVTKVPRIRVRTMTKITGGRLNILDCATLGARRGAAAPCKVGKRTYGSSHWTSRVRSFGGTKDIESVCSPYPQAALDWHGRRSGAGIGAAEPVPLPTYGNGNRRAVADGLGQLASARKDFLQVSTPFRWRSCGTASQSGNSLARSAVMSLYMQMYMPLLLTCCIVSAGYVVARVLNGGGIDPGPPNARS
jgi:hypothetical protein